MHTLASEWRDAAALETPVDVGTPDVVGALAVFPLLSRTTGPPAYRSLAAALEHGARIEEAPAASVGALIVHNPLHLPVLLYEGQEVLGARQNRVFASSALVPAGASLRVPVTCVERHRWDDRRHREPLKLSSHTTHPTLRGLSHHQKAAGRHAVQTAVWESVSATLRHHRVDSSHQAMDDLYEARRVDLHAVARAIGLRDGQVGTLAAISGRFAVLDHVSQPTAFHRLKNPLVIGYALDALTAPEAAPPSQADGRDFVELLWRSPRTRTPAVGLGDTLMFGFGGLAGIGLEWSGKTITLTAYA